MREIKFRIWDKIKKEFLEDPTVFINLHEDNYGFGFITKEPNSGTAIRSIETFEVEQYTGLRDKNGKEIYEGDIVCKVSSCKAEMATGIICYYADGIAFYIKRLEGYEWAFYMPDGSNWHKTLIEVIGNVHENPELLEAKP